MIERMEKSGKIEKTGDYNVYKIGKPVTTKEDFLLGIFECIVSAINFLLMTSLNFDCAIIVLNQLLEFYWWMTGQQNT